jgi:hypothetical protein
MILTEKKEQSYTVAREKRLSIMPIMTVGRAR